MLGIAIFTLAMVTGQVASHPPAFTLNDEAGQGRIAPLPFEMTNPHRVAAGELYQSDMLLTEEQWAAKRERKAIDSASSRWSEGDNGFPFVPYVFEDSVDQSDVKDGLDHWMEHTCIKFGETTDEDQPHLQFHIGSGCWSYIGMISSWKGQQVSVGSGCNSLGTIVHEVGHAMGFYHEQSRSDRDDHVVILTENIESGKEGNFDKEADDNYNVPYDYSSNMHYGMTYFTVDGSPTIVTKDPMAQELIGSRNGLTHRDKLLANRMYGCLGKWLDSCKELTSDPCLNDGYIGVDCICVCPPGTSGDNCETVTDDYYAELRSPRSEKISTAKSITIKTPMSAGDSFVKWIVPPTCKSAKLTITLGDMYSGDCYFQSLNIKTDPTNYAGEKLCATDVSEGKTFTSEEGIIITMTNNVNYGFEKTLWEADVTFEDISGCSPGTTTPGPTEASTKASTEATTEATTSYPGPEAPVLPCEKKAKVIKIPKGEYRTITSPDFPSDYPKKSKCKWTLKAPKNCKLSIYCDTFSLNKKDKLKINKETFTKNGPVEHDDASKLKISFKSKKSGPGFRCIVGSCIVNTG